MMFCKKKRNKNNKRVLCITGNIHMQKQNIIRNLQCQPGPATLANQTNSQVASTAREYSLDSGCDTLN